MTLFSSILERLWFDPERFGWGPYRHSWMRFSIQIRKVELSRGSVPHFQAKFQKWSLLSKRIIQAPAEHVSISKNVFPEAEGHFRCSGQSQFAGIGFGQSEKGWGRGRFWIGQSEAGKVWGLEQEENAFDEGNRFHPRNYFGWNYSHFDQELLHRRLWPLRLRCKNDQEK